MSVDRLVVEIAGDSTKLNNALQSSINRLNSFNTRVTNSSRNLTRMMSQISALSGALGGLTTAANGAAAAQTRMSTAGAAAGRAMQNTQRRVNGLTDSFRQMVVGLSSIQTMFYQYAFFVGGFATALIKTNAEYERQFVLLKNLSKASTEAGRAQEALENITWIRKLGTEAPFAVSSITDSFVKLKVGGIDPTNGSLQTLLDSVAAFGGGSEQLKRAAVAIQQMGGKGVVSMEELRQQLGEAVPDAMNAMQQATHMTMREFVKTVSEGQLESTTALQKMFNELRLRYSGAASQMMDTWSGLMARLTTAWEVFVVKISDGPNSENGFFKTLKEQIKELTIFLNTPAGDTFARSVSEGLARIVIGIGNLIKFVYQWRNEIVTAAKIMFTMWAGKMVLGTISGVVGGLGTLITRGVGVFNMLRRLQTVQNGVNLVTLLFGRNVTQAARALGLFNAAGAISIGRLGALALRFGLAGAAALTAAAGVWVLYRALTAANRQQEASKKLRESAANGDIFLDMDEAAKQRNDIIRRRAENQRAIEANRASRAYNPLREQQLLKQQKEIEADRVAFDIKATNTRAAREEASTMRYANKYQEHTDKRVKIVDDRYNRERIAIEQGEGTAEQKDKLIDAARAKAYSQRGQILADQARRAEEGIAKARTTAGKAAAEQELARIREQIVQNADAERLNLAPDAKLAGDKDGGSKKDKGAESDGFDGLRNRLVNLKVQAAELNSELTDTQDIFDSWDVEEKQTEIAKGLGGPELRKQINLTKEDIKKLKREMNVKEAVAELADEVEENTIQATAALFEMENGFKNIDAQVEVYTNRLVERYSKAIQDARLLDGNANNEDMMVKGKRETLIWDSMTEAARQYRLEIVNNLGEKAKDIHEERLMQLMTMDQRREFLYQKEIARLKSELAAAEALKGAASEAANNIRNAIDALTATNNEKRKAGPLADWARDAADWRENMMQSTTGLLDGFVDDLAQGKFAFKAFTKAILVDLLKIILRALIAKAILGALGLGTGVTQSDTQSMIAANPGVFHTGGVVGESQMTRSVSAGLFSFAQRYHTGGIVGLGSNEVPIIAEKGEGVFTKDQMKAMGQQKGSNVQVNVINQTGTEAEVERKPAKFDGEKWVEDIILKKLTRPGPVRTVLGSMGKG
jgi:tape measure domain-containing protein